jgi:hypothetical protein
LFALLNFLRFLQLLQFLHLFQFEREVGGP